MANGWTAERKAKQAALIQSWKPWNSSTGAKTPEGKAASSRNAYKHGNRSLAREMAAVLREQKECLKLIN